MELPPYAALLGLDWDDAAAEPTLLLPFAGEVAGRPGFLHGGAIGGLLEMAALTTLRHALADPYVRIDLVTLTVDFMRGGRDKPTRARGIVRRIGTRIANIDAVAWQDELDQPIAAARGTFRLERP